MLAVTGRGEGGAPRQYFGFLVPGGPAAGPGGFAGIPPPGGFAGIPPPGGAGADPQMGDGGNVPGGGASHPLGSAADNMGSIDRAMMWLGYGLSMGKDIPAAKAKAAVAKAKPKPKPRGRK